MRFARARRLVALAALLVACAVAPTLACARVQARSRPDEVDSRARERVSSNVERRDYAGSAACARCHAAIAAAWARLPMHRMTREANGIEVRAPFDGTRWRFKEDSVVLDCRGDDRFCHVETSRGARNDYRVTMVLGGRTREDFVGVDVATGGDELVLPVSYVFKTGALRYKGYSVMVHERTGLRAGPRWKNACVFCHNTVPQVDRLLGALCGPKPSPYQGEQVDRWLPIERRQTTSVVENGSFAQSVAAETAHLGHRLRVESGPPDTLACQAIAIVRSRFDRSSLVEVGIGCEACHGGAREHALDPGVRPALSPVAPWLRVDLPNPSTAAAINRVCAGCHQVLFSRYPFTWEGGRRDAGAGGSHINSGEGRDFLLGGCTSAMACTACHDPHGSDDAVALDALATPAGNATCTRCHADLADRDRLRTHSHHDPAGAGGSCVACHMPRKNMGLDGSLTRYHRIGSPTDPARVLGDRPIECALCHGDRSVGRLVDAMETWWPVRYPRPQLEELYGSLDANVIRATLERGKPHERAVAIAALGEARARDAASLVARELLDEYPLVREWAKRALTSILGRCDVDLAADDDTIWRQAVSSCGGSLEAAPAKGPTGRGRGSDGSGSLDEDPED